VDAELDGMAMAIRDDGAGQLGLQFHPESILTPKGDRLVAALLEWARQRAAPLPLQEERATTVG
jgi:anthranilate synthase component 2